MSVLASRHGQQPGRSTKGRPKLSLAGFEFSMTRMVYSPNCSRCAAGQRPEGTGAHDPVARVPSLARVVLREWFAVDDDDDPEVL